MTRERWFELLDYCDEIQRECDILAAKDDLADLIKAILIEMRPPNAHEALKLPVADKFTEDWHKR